MLTFMSDDTEMYKNSWVTNMTNYLHASSDREISRGIAFPMVYPKTVCNNFNSKFSLLKLVKDCNVNIFSTWNVMRKLSCFFIDAMEIHIRK